MISESFGARMRIERERLGFSQAEFAEKLGINRITLSQFERDIRMPGGKHLKRAIELGLDIYFLFINKRVEISDISPEEQAEDEKLAFELLGVYVENSCDGKLPYSEQYVLFCFLRKAFANMRKKGQVPDSNVSLDELMQTS